EKRDAVVADLDEATVDGDRLIGALGGADGHLTDVERANEGDVTGQEGDVAAPEGAGRHHLGLTGPQDALRRDDLDLQGHWAPSWRTARGRGPSGSPPKAGVKARRRSSASATKLTW